MNYLLASCLAMSVYGFGAASLDGTTNVPLQWVFACLSGVLLAGMWVSRKVTKFETVCEQFALQQAANMARLDRQDQWMRAFDDRLCSMDDRFTSNHDKIQSLHERLFAVERNKG